jgi:hypothetical protein
MEEGRPAISLHNSTQLPGIGFHIARISIGRLNGCAISISRRIHQA